MKIYYFFSVMLGLLPFVIFFLLDRPHDCFVCLGKDPDRIYSVFQLKKEERNARNMFAKYSVRN